MSQLPLVSVIVPAYNAATYIGQALASVCAQTYRHLEIVVVDDGSQDETAAVVTALAAEDPRITLLRQTNQGVAVARNRALDQTSGEFIAPLDADDLWYSDKIERQVACMLNAGPKVGLVYSWWIVIDDEGHACTEIRQPALTGNVLEALIRGNFVGNASVPLIRRHCFDHVGGYNSILCEDWDLALRLAEHYEFRVVPACLAAYRKLAGKSLSSDFTSMARSYEWMIDAIAERHPEIDAATYQQSRAAFYLYLVRNSYIDGNHPNVLRWAFHAFRAQPSSLLAPWALFVVLTSLPATLARPLVAAIWPDRRTWTRLSRLWIQWKRRAVPPRA